MTKLKNFDYYLDKGIIKKQSPDKERSESLLKDSEKNYEFLKEVIDKIGINENNANSLIKQSYDILMEVIRAKMFLEGLNSSGFSAHEAEVAYLQRLNFSQKEIEFADQLRYFRNGIMYYGKSFDKNYVGKVIKFLEDCRKKLK